jgi:hypothetical protein
MSRDELSIISVRQINIEDDHAAPLAKEGEIILIDPTDGDLFLTLTDKGKMVVVGFAETSLGWFARCPNLRRVVGPMDIDFLRIRVLGRVICAGRILDKGMRASTIGPSP